MLGFNFLLAVCLSYVAILFAVAFVAERRASEGRVRWLHSPIVYTLALSIYATGWTFFGAVGNAARTGLEFITIYLGPTIVLIGWWTILRKLVRIGRTQRITSIADMISSRYGKSGSLAVWVTILAVIGTTPYIALQLQSVTLAFEVFAPQNRAPAPGSLDATAVWVAAGLAMFTIIFGTRKLDVNERHHGIVMAIALEAIVKLVALVAVGVFVVWGVAGGIGPTVAAIEASPISEMRIGADRWIALTFVAGVAFFCLPRMFQVLVIENSDETQLATAAWAFPLYLLLISLFVVPIAVIGLQSMPAGANPDTFVLTVPLAFGREGLAMLSFLGGFSAATSMVIMASIALSTMVSNHIVLPLWLHARREQPGTDPGDVRHVILTARRLTIVALLALGFGYYHFSGGGATLAAMGLVSFVGVAQIMPALVGGIFWRGATRVGALAGLLSGFAIWFYTYFLPSLGADVVLSSSVLEFGPFGIAALSPVALFGISGLDPFVHAVFWSMVINTSFFVIGSLMSFPKPIERLQGAAFVNVYRYSESTQGLGPNLAEAEELLVMAQRIIGSGAAQRLFAKAAQEQGKPGLMPDVTPAFVAMLERRFAGSVGAATAHAMIGQITGGATVSVEDLMKVADEAAQIMEYSSQLEAKSIEHERTARQLRDANDKLTELSIQKDAFLSQVSHELRTPMTSIRAFSEILMADEAMTGLERAKYSKIIHDETQRLTRLLDDLLDLSVLENGQVSLNMRSATLREVLDHSVAATGQLGGGSKLQVSRHRGHEALTLWTDPDRLAQVFINVIANAQKYCLVDTPELRITAGAVDGVVIVDMVDNGAGIPSAKQSLIFEKFSRLSDQHAAGGAGLGLAICREIMDKLGGSISYLPGQGGAAFRIHVPAVRAAAA